MFFLAGLLVAGLAGLLILPAFARRALRLSEARARMLAPLSMKDVIAERDLLRAEHALEQHRLERRVASLQDANAGLRANLGRRDANIVAFEGRTADLLNEIAAREVDIRGLEAELGAQRIVVNDFGGQLERSSAEIAALWQRRLVLETAADDHRTTIAGLETRASGLEMKLADAAQAAKYRAGVAQTEMNKVSAELALRTGEIARLNGELGAALAKSAGLVADLEKRSAELGQTRRRLGEIEALAATRLQALESGAAENRRRADGGYMRDSDPATRGDLALRDAISRLAADVARLSSSSGNALSIRSRPGKIRRFEPRVLSSQTQDPGAGAGAGAVPAQPRQLQPTAPER